MIAANSDHAVLEQKVNHGSKHRSSKASHSKTEKALWTLFEGPMKNPKHELLLSNKHNSKSRNSSHSKAESKLLTLFEGPLKNPKQELLLSKKPSSKSRISKARHSKTENPKHELIHTKTHSSKSRNSKASHSKTESKLVTLFEGPMKNPKQDLLLSKRHSSMSRNSKASHPKPKIESKLVTLFEGPLKNPKQELLLTKKHSSKSMISKSNHSKTESKLLTLTKKRNKHTQKDQSESLSQVRCHHQKSNPSSQCAGCQPAYLNVSSSSFDALAALYSDDFVYPDPCAEVLDNVETFISRYERFGNIDRPRKIGRSSGRN